MRDSTRRASRGRHGLGFPARGNTTLRSVGGDEASAMSMLPDLRTVKDVVMNTVESVYPWMGITVGVVLRRNPIVRYVAPVAGIAIGIAKALTHTEDKIIAETVAPTDTAPPA